MPEPLVDVNLPLSKLKESIGKERAEIASQKAVLVARDKRLQAAEKHVDILQGVPVRKRKVKKKADESAPTTSSPQR